MINIIGNKKVNGSMFLPLYIYKYNENPTTERINTGIPYIDLDTSNIIDNNGLSTQFLYDNGLLTGIIKNNLIQNHFIYDKAGHIQRVNI